MASILSDFSWGVGIEDTFIPQARPGLRAMDEYQLTDHYKRWREDFDLLNQAGVQHIRWGIPWYKVNPASGKWDWGWIDEALDYLVNKCKVTPIIDLMHYGTPLWLENAFINAHYPEAVAEYAGAFAKRYAELVRYYTPLNEPWVNALWCGKLGQWPPHLEGDDGYAKVLMAVVKGICLTEQAIRAADPDAIIVQVEPIEHHYSSVLELQDRVNDEIAHVYLAVDLFTGQVDNGHRLIPWLRTHGVSDADLQWFRDNAIKVDMIGVNYYPVSGGEWTLDADGKPFFTRGVTVEHLETVFRRTWERYGLPMLLSETGFNGSLESRVEWFDKSVAIVRKLIGEGLPIRGYTWWPLFDMIEWDYRIDGGSLWRYALDGGLWAINFKEPANLLRVRTPLADRFQSYATGNR